MEILLKFSRLLVQKRRRVKLYFIQNPFPGRSSRPDPNFSRVAECCNANLQVGCPEGFPALRNLALKRKKTHG